MSASLLLGIGCLLGCKNDSANAEVAPKSNTPILSPYEQYRSGIVQIGGAAELLAECIPKIKSMKTKLSKKVHEDVDVLMDQIDAAGTCLADFEEEPASQQEFDKTPQLKAKLIDAANDAIHELEGVPEILESIDNDPEADLNSIGDIVDEAIQDLEEAVETMGGKLEDL